MTADRDTLREQIETAISHHRVEWIWKQGWVCGCDENEDGNPQRKYPTIGDVYRHRADAIMSLVGPALAKAYSYGYQQCRRDAQKKAAAEARVLGRFTDYPELA